MALNFQALGLSTSSQMFNLRTPRVCMASTFHSTSAKEVKNLKRPFSPPREVHVQVTHSMPPQKLEIFKSLENWAENNLLIYLKPVEKSWQPQDFLPDAASEEFYDDVKELRERSKELPDDYFVVLVGDMVTEEALPTYQTMLNTMDGVRDETGASPTPWAIWTRAWTAEENRHGDLLNKYLYLSGRVDMKQIEKTIQYLIGSGMARHISGYRPIAKWWKMRRELKERFIPMNYGEVSFRELLSLKMGLSSLDDYTDQFYLFETHARLHETEQQRDPRTENSPYLGFVYTSFQERATFISHGNTARLAKEHGDLKLAQICGTIAADEKRHETAYTKITEKLFEVDPDGTMLAFADMMRKKIQMPAHLVYDGSDDNLFEHFSAVAQRLGVYTVKDYADILEFLVGRWDVEKITGLSGEGQKAQDYVCGLGPRIRRLEERAQGRAKQGPKIPFSWIFNNEVQL
ncbi:hypothetical protein GIB67_008385 [Kingdonia uniflora]|uniref:Acyl-[acyl-carrier-protein] desaturase n=1 Tax=Kingdonia uniflora TaxID=39325 RepID=A0A7J7N545_9MAGN|nr:hypothetical protein GIB67_008385 [Kingdonia uniflora]